MQLTVVDGNGAAQIICVQGVQTPTSRSGSIALANTSQQLMAANATRSGWYIQNQDDTALTVNEMGGDATTAGSIIVWPGQSFPPPNYPVTTLAITIASSKQGAVFAAREW
jgi:hypothetical protein